MPGRFFITMPMRQVADHLGASCDIADPGPRPDAAPGEDVAVLVAGRKLQDMRWGMIMSGRRNARGRPVMETIVNARSETVFDKSAFAGVQRCVLPVSGWYEWTGAARRKTRWRIFAPDSPLLLFAAIYDVWNGPGGVTLAQMATVTTEPNADVKDYHHRMPALLDDQALAIWLDEATGDPRTVLRPAAKGLLTVERAEA